MGELIVCINCYQDVDLIDGCLDRIKTFLPEAKIVAVDGVYQTFHDQAKLEAANCMLQGLDKKGESFLRFTTPVSTDGTIDILHKYKVDVIIQSTKPWANEHEKRSRYFIGKPGDYYVVIDSDEYIRGTFKLDDLMSSDTWCISLKRDDNIDPYPVHRIFKHTDGIRYIGTHFAVHIPDGNGGYKMYKKDDYSKNFTLPNVLLEHRWCERGTKDTIRHEAKGSYYRVLLEQEGLFRGQHGI